MENVCAASKELTLNTVNRDVEDAVHEKESAVKAPKPSDPVDEELPAG